MAVINSLGIGSGVLTADLIDKLKNNEKSATVTPIETKITLATQKQSALDLLSSLTTAFKSNVSALSQDTLYQERTVSGNNDDVSVTAATGTATQSMTISDVNLATTNVQQSGNFSAKTDKIATGTGTLTISIGGENVAIEYDAGTSLDDLKTKITNSTANDDLTASILQVGEDAYTFVLTSKETGQDQSITITDNAGHLDTKLLSNTHKSGSFLAADDFIAGSGTSGNIQIDINGVTQDLAYDDTTTLTQLKDMINSDETLKSVISANIVQEGDNDFKLVLTPIGAQSGQSISITDSAAGLDGKILTTGSTTSAGTLNEVQAASDSSFKYNGIMISRSSNTIDDIATGVSISLLKNSGSANINISQDEQPIVDELKNFVTSYNTLQQQLSSMTGTDLEAGTVGIFNGDSSIRNIGREITNLITYSDLNGNSLAAHGIEIDKTGTMSFNLEDFNTKMDASATDLGEFFSGKTTVDSNDVATHTDGIFETINDKLYSYTKSNGLLYLFNQGLETEFESLSQQHDKTLAILDARYELMTKRFIAYDGVISGLNAQASALTQQIDMALAAAKA
ncbi:MAG: flagellar filament capping protein FliD [Campylobacterota bacterium]|nr:flagellar filament capping protein FliD [Campylobacterota bacterium]